MKQFFAWFWLVGLLSSMQSAILLPENTSDAPLWMRYPVISPDGNWIVFTYKGDLFKVSASGGDAIQLTSSEFYEYMPVFSADGSTIAFASDRYGNFDVYTMSINGGNATRLTMNSSQDVPQCFSADGKSVQFAASRLDEADMIQHPYGLLGEVYEVPITGGREKQILTICAEDAKWNKKGTKMIFHDRKGYEDPMRKHHTSSVARDLWLFDKTAQNFIQLTTFNGEDRNPVWNTDESAIFFLSERSGSFNVWKMDPSAPDKATAVSNFSKNPVRFLSISNNNTLCYGYDGEIYTQQPGSEPKKVNIRIALDDSKNIQKQWTASSGATEASLSPNGKEVAFILRGEVFVTSVEGGVTKRITNTPEQERNVSWSPDGKAILYASERGNTWGIYQTTLPRKEEKYFYAATLLDEDTLVKNENEAFQPAYSPDGKEIAFLENRTGISIYNLATKKIRNVHAANKNYSYSDGDQSFNWSADSRYLLVDFLMEGNWHTQLGLVDVTGKEPLLQLTQNGFSNSGAQFQMNGKAVLFYSDKNGLKNVASWGAQSDAYAIFLDQATYDVFKMRKSDYELWKEQQEEEKKTTEESAEKKDTKSKKGDKKADSTKVEPLKIDKEGLLERRVRITPASSNMGDAYLSNDGESAFYFAKFDEGYNLYQRKFKDDETKVLTRLNASWVSSEIDAEGKKLLCIADGRLSIIDLSNGEKKDVNYSADMSLDAYAERAYLFEHMWRQVKRKFYRTDLQGVDWDGYKAIYAKFLPHINNNRDFAEMMSELLGELNASHTGCFYRNWSGGDETATLGAFYDESYTGDGLKVKEILAKGPLGKASTKIKAGVIIEKIDGNDIKANTNYYPFLNKKAGKFTLLSLYDPSTKTRWEETVKPTYSYMMGEWLYERWIERMQAATEKLSGGQLGYMHVHGMDDESYREFFDQVMGKYVNKKALIVDTRFNGGGWLHDDLATFLSGKQYIEFMPREQKIGKEPQGKWTKPSCVLMGEGNYSDAHMFPMVYKTLGIGKLVGMPVPGTGTAVWWENLQDQTLVFGIPQVGVMTMDGKYYENNQCEPDIKVMLDYNSMIKGEDVQLKKAVEHLMGL